jgi:biotin operon repressor
MESNQIDRILTAKGYRLKALIEALKQGGSIRLLAKTVGCTERSVYRDLLTLRAKGFNIVKVRASYYKIMCLLLLLSSCAPKNYPVF